MESKWASGLIFEVDRQREREGKCSSFLIIISSCLSIALFIDLNKQPAGPLSRKILLVEMIEIDKGGRIALQTARPYRHISRDFIELH